MPKITQLPIYLEVNHITEKRIFFNKLGKLVELYKILTKGIYTDPEKYHNLMTSEVSKRPYVSDRIKGIVEKYFSHNENLKILDIAAGTGIISNKLSSLGEVIALDLSEEFLNFLQTNNNKIKTIVGNMNKDYSFIEDNSLNVVVTMGSNRYFTRKGVENFLNESMRILKKDGIIIFPIITPEAYLSRKRQFKGAKYPYNVKNISNYFKEYLKENGHNISLELDKKDTITKYIIIKKND